MTLGKTVVSLTLRVRDTGKYTERSNAATASAGRHAEES